MLMNATIASPYFVGVPGGTIWPDEIVAIADFSFEGIRNRVRLPLSTPES